MLKYILGAIWGFACFFLGGLLGFTNIFQVLILCFAGIIVGYIVSTQFNKEKK